MANTEQPCLTSQVISVSTSAPHECLSHLNSRFTEAILRAAGHDVKAKSILESLCSPYSHNNNVPLSLFPPKVQSFFPLLSHNARLLAKCQSQLFYIVLNRLGRAEGLVLLCCRISTLHESYETFGLRRLTKHLSEEETVALLEGDAVSVDKNVSI